MRDFTHTAVLMQPQDEMIDRQINLVTLSMACTNTHTGLGCLQQSDSASVKESE